MENGNEDLEVLLYGIGENDSDLCRTSGCGRLSILLVITKLEKKIQNAYFGGQRPDRIESVDER